MKGKVALKKWNAPIICFFTFFIVMLILFLQFCYLSLSKKVYGINMKEFASNRNTVSSVLTAKRGNIYDVEGNVLAQNIISYTLIAYLDPTRTIDENDPKHVVDKEYTAIKLASVLGEENKEYILKRLNTNSKQVEFGSIGKNLTELTKIAIEELNLPGISFTETVKRYYPNGNFASYIIGYAKQYTRINLKVGQSYDLYDYYKNYFNNFNGITIEYSNTKTISLDDKTVKALQKGTSLLFIKTYGETLATILVNVSDNDVYQTIDNTIVGELGIESNYDKKLQGVDGYVKYQQDKYGYKIPDTPEERVEAIDGYDIYLTIDSNIQRFAENAISTLKEKYNPNWSIATVVDAKSGAILASATSPSFNPNSLTNEMSYQNPLVSYTYEPGSVMKIYTYMCAIETGLYDGNKTYLSGSYKFEDGTIMHDWNNDGWGILTYDNGFSYSSNTAIINIIKDYLSVDKLKTCLESYGFGEKTGIELSNEETGNIKFLYDTELSAAGFGQGISTTTIQQLQALTLIANDGIMIKPHIISKIVDKQTKEEYVTEIEKSKKLVSTKTINYVKDLMESVIQSDSPTGYRYYLDGYDLIGKTGTAQIYENGKYLSGSNDYLVSVAIMYPKDDPEIILYLAAKQPSNIALALPDVTKELIQNISKYKGMSNENSDQNISSSYTIDSYINLDISLASNNVSNLSLNPIIIGDGNRVINQYPSKGLKALTNDKVFLVTNGDNIYLPDFTGWSRYNVMKYCELTNLECNFSGYGYVESQNIAKNTLITSDIKLEITLKNLYSDN